MTNRFVILESIVCLVWILSFPNLSCFDYGLNAQSLWEDHNPYALGSNLRPGTIIKLIVDEPVRIIYEYENHLDKTIDIKLLPDSNITNFLPPANTNYNTTKKYTNRLNSRSRVQLKMAVILDGAPENDIVTFNGSKTLIQENNMSRQQLRIQGELHIDDISSMRTAHSNDVANLRIIILGAPFSSSRNFTPPTPQEEQAESSSQQTPETSSSSLTPEQRQQLLLEYINRFLGEISIP